VSAAVDYSKGTKRKKAPAKKKKKASVGRKKKK
jgi:hypothetical protein